MRKSLTNGPVSDILHPDFKRVTKVTNQWQALFEERKFWVSFSQAAGPAGADRPGGAHETQALIRPFAKFMEVQVSCLKEAGKPQSSLSG